VDFSEARDLFGIIFQFQGANCKIRDCGLILEKLWGLSAKMTEIGISRNCFSKGKPVDQVRESMDRAGQVHHGPATIAMLGSSTELGLRPLWCLRAPTEGRGRGRAGRRAQ
jgi:hypothetical protein